MYSHYQEDSRFYVEIEFTLMMILTFGIFQVGKSMNVYFEGSSQILCVKGDAIQCGTAWSFTPMSVFYCALCKCFMFLIARSSRVSLECQDHNGREGSLNT